MGSHRLKWGWWLVAAIAVAVAASLLLHRRPAVPSGQPEASAPVAPASASVSSDEAGSVGAVVRDTVYVAVDDEEVPVIREQTQEAGEPSAETPAATLETVITVPVKEVSGLIREKSGQDITLTAQAPDRLILTYAGKVDIPMLGEQGMDFSAGFRIVEVKDDRLVLQLDSGTAMNIAADALAPYVLEHLPAGLVDSFSGGRAVINLSAIKRLKKKLSGVSLTGVSVDEEAIRLRAVEK